MEGKGMLKEFKEFAFKGNVVDMAVGVMIGGAFFAYGSFITTVLDFLIMAFCIFLMVKGINRLRALSEKNKAAEPVEEKKPRLCPYCFEEVNEKATRCPHCAAELPAEEPENA